MSEVCKAHEKELADMNSANAVMKAKLGKAPADVKDLQEELASNQDLLADNQTKDDEIIASGKAQVEALKAYVLEMENKLIEVYKVLENQFEETQEEGKDQIERLEARIAVLDG